MKSSSHFHLISGEDHLKHQLQEHEFSFDPLAWQSMDELLDQTTEGEPQTDVSIVPGAAIGLSLLPMIAIFVLFLFVSMSGRTSSDPSEIMLPIHTDTTQIQVVVQQQEISENAKNYVKNEKQATKIFKNSAIDDAQTINLPGNQLSVIQADGAAIAQPPSAVVGQTHQDSPIDILPVQMVSPVLKKSVPNIDSVRYPEVPVMDRAIHVGVIYGGSLTATTYTPVRFSARPLFGVFARKRIGVGTDIQAEFSFKWASNYDFMAKYKGAYLGTSGPLIWEQIYSGTKLAYFDLPVMLRMQSKYKPLFWMLGGRASYIIPTNKKYESTCTCEPNEEPAKFTDLQAGLRRVDGALLIGAEYRWGERVYVDLRYNQGLFDLSKNSFFKDSKLHLSSDIQLTFRTLLQ